SAQHIECDHQFPIPGCWGSGFCSLCPRRLFQYQDCKDFHQAKDGDGWVEQSSQPFFFGLLQKVDTPSAFVCADSKIYNASEWYICQGMRCPANTHKPSFHVNTSVTSTKHNSGKGTNSGQQGGRMPASVEECMTEEEFVEWLQNAMQTGMYENFSAGTSTESPSTKSGNGTKTSGSANKRKKKGKKQCLKLEKLQEEDLVERPFKRKQIRIRFPEWGRSGRFAPFGDKVLFSRANLTIEIGEKLAIIGPNGCGKSTLLKLIMGLQKPIAGEVLLGELNVLTNFFEQNQFMACLRLSCSVGEERQQPTQADIDQVRNEWEKFVVNTYVHEP
ncbi:hypothetical protein ABKV19_026158, partial [Rosa sericea]